jgi:hypothetical protein
MQVVTQLCEYRPNPQFLTQGKVADVLPNFTVYAHNGCFFFVEAPENGRYKIVIDDVAYPLVYRYGIVNGWIVRGCGLNQSHPAPLVNHPKYHPKVQSYDDAIRVVESNYAKYHGGILKRKRIQEEKRRQEFQADPVAYREKYYPRMIAD